MVLREQARIYAAALGESAVNASNPANPKLVPDIVRPLLRRVTEPFVDVRTISVYPIHHDKVIVADRRTVELGSFNYSDAAARRNSENVLVNWGNTRLADVYLQHFDRNYRQAVRFEPAYR